MEEQFLKLQNIVDTVETFYFGMAKQYLGPVNPVAIVSFGSNIFRVNVLILAESVSSTYIPIPLEPDHVEAVTVYLDDNFEFRHHHQKEKELQGLSLLVGDPTYLYDGTITGAREFFRGKNWELNLLYSKISN